ncbi:hypothetical protein QTP86_010191 [Hemibagrus guttatus]|nr:hypothetical protein QTP86_010191 [Hemibagrus guttatus]
MTLSEEPQVLRFSSYEAHSIAKRQPGAQRQTVSLKGSTHMATGSGIKPQGNAVSYITMGTCLALVENFTWSLNTSSISKKAQQHLNFLRRLRKAHLPPPILTMLYRGTIESVLRSCITAWFGNCTISDRKTLQRIVKTAEKIIGSPLHHRHLLLCSIGQMAKGQKGDGLDVRGPEGFSEPFSSLWMYTVLEGWAEEHQ